MHCASSSPTMISSTVFECIQRRGRLCRIHLGEHRLLQYVRLLCTSSTCKLRFFFVRYSQKICDRILCGEKANTQRGKIVYFFPVTIVESRLNALNVAYVFSRISLYEQKKTDENTINCSVCTC